MQISGWWGDCAALLCAEHHKKYALWFCRQVRISLGLKLGTQILWELLQSLEHDMLREIRHTRNFFLEEQVPNLTNILERESYFFPKRMFRKYSASLKFETPCCIVKYFCKFCRIERFVQKFHEIYWGHSGEQWTWAKRCPSVWWKWKLIVVCSEETLRCCSVTVTG